MNQTIPLNENQSTDPVVDGLQGNLYDTMVATVKAQNYHWNVTGMAFASLHALFEEIYNDHAAAQDQLAERVKALGGHVDGRMQRALASTRLKECDGNVDCIEMLKNLAKDQQSLSFYMHKLADIADENGDLVTNDMAIERADAHDKFAWMLNAHLGR